MIYKSLEHVPIPAKNYMQGAPSTAPNSGIPAGARLRSVEDALEAGGHAAGVIFRDPDGRILLLRRSPTEENYAGHWALPGGKAELGESPEEAARREAGEEIGAIPDGDMRIVDRKRTPTGMTFHTFAQDVPEAFEPRLNGEHSEHTWVAQDDLPTPLHPAVARTLEERGPEIAGDAEFRESDHPRAPDGKFGSGGGGSGGESKSGAGASLFAKSGNQLPPKVYRGASPENEEQSTMAEGRGVYVSTNPQTAKEWGNAKEYSVKTQPNLLDLGNYNGRARDFVAKYLGINPKKLTREMFDETAPEIFIQNGGVDIADQMGFKGYRLLDDAFMMGKLSDYADVKKATGLTNDAEFKEGDHPRAPDGKFGSGGGSSGESKSKEEIRNARFENKFKEEPTQLFKGLLSGGGHGVTKEQIAEGKSRLDEIHRQLEGERKEHGAAIEKERLEKAEKLGGKSGEHATALIKAGVDKEKFGPAFEALKADKSISAGDLTQISQLYGHHGFKGSKGAMLDQIEKAFIRNARFENKISGDEPSLTREQAGYVFPAPGPDFCHGCSMFRPAADGQHDDKCTLVKGGIEAKGVCDHFAARGATDSALLIALDKDSVRSLDKDGRMRVETTNISKATVNPYVGHEIPDWEKLSLDPNKIYQMLRDPEELRKAAPTFNGVQLLRKHIPVSAEDHQPYDIVGTTGTDAEFDGTYLKNSLHVWTQEAIDDIESEAKKELSCGYHYRADMTPGVFDGKAFDGVMRDIVGNHVALVKDGRAGPDVVVGDSNEGLQMTNKELATKLAALAARQTTIGSIYSYLRPRIRIAQDSKPLGIGAAFKDVTGKNFAERKPAILKALTSIVKPHLAKDASIEGLGKMLDILESHEVEDNKDESVSEAQHNAMEAAAHGESKLDIPAKVGKEFADKDKGKTFDAAAEFLKGRGLSEDDCKQVMDMLGYGEQGEDESQEEEDDKERKEDLKEKKAEDDAEGMEPGGKMVSKKAMDAAIAKATKIAADNAIKIQREIRDAEKAVHPYVGELKIACDSAEEVYRKALEILGVEGAGTIHASALPTLLGLQPKPGARRPTERLAQDSSAAKSYAERFPDAARIGNV